MDSSLPSLKRDKQPRPITDAPLRGVISGALLGLLLWIVIGVGTSYALGGSSAARSVAVHPHVETVRPASLLNG